MKIQLFLGSATNCRPKHSMLSTNTTEHLKNSSLYDCIMEIQGKPGTRSMNSHRIKRTMHW